MPRLFFPGVTALCALLAASCRESSPAPSAPADAARPAVDAAPPVEAVDAAPPGPRPADPAPAGNLVAPRAQYRFAVYYLPLPRVDPFTTLSSLPQAQPFRVLAQVPETPPDVAAVAFIAPRIESFAPPPPAALAEASVGLDDAQQHALLTSEQVSVLSFFVPEADIEPLYERALRVVGDFARKTGGVAWDDVTRQAFSAAAWQARIDGFELGLPIVSRHVRVGAYRETNGLGRVVTLGMQKLGLPDVAVSDVPPAAIEGMRALVGVFCQLLAERRGLIQAGEIALSIEAVSVPKARAELKAKRHGGKGVTQASVLVGEPKEGDALNRLLEITFPGPPQGLAARQVAAITELFGTMPDAGAAPAH